MRRAALLLTSAAVAVLGGASLAWACTVQVGMHSTTQAGSVGVTFLASASAGPDQPGQREIRWDALDGPVVSRLSAAVGAPGTTMLEVTVPPASPGVHYLVFRAGDLGVARMAFEVTPSPGAVAAPAPSSAGPWSGFASGATAGPTPSPVSSTPGLGLGLGLLGAGLVAVSALAVGELRRGRVRARAAR